jgi:CheY-like chemotaxis protein
MRSDAIDNTTPHSGVTAQDAQEPDDMGILRVLVIDDDSASRLALVHALAPYWTITEAASVASALSSLAITRYDAVVCDLKMDAPSEPLHDVLSHQGVPVVMVSGIEPERLPEATQRRGWRYLAKPCDPEALVSQVRAVMGRASQSGERASGERMTVVPTGSSAPAIDTSAQDRSTPVQRETTPAEGVQRAATPMSERAQIHNDWSRRLKHSIIAMIIGALTFYGQRTGHPVEWYVVAILGAIAVGPEAVKNAIVARPKAVTAGLAGLIGLAVLGDATDQNALSALSSLGVAALPVVDRIATVTGYTE